MAVFPAFRDGSTVLRRNPVILVAGILMMVVGQLATVAEHLDSLALLVVGYPIAFFLGPFFLAGILGMALEGLDGRTSFDRLLEAGRRYYVSMLGATVLFLAAVIAAMIAVFVVTMVVLVVAVGASALGEGADVVGLLGFGTVLLLFPAFMLLLFVLFMFLQFFDAAIVVENERAVDSFSRSIEVVRSNLRSVVGYTVLWGTLSVVAFAPLTAIDVALSGTASLAAIPLAVIVGGVVQAYLYAVHAAYYTRLVPDWNSPA